MMDEAARAKHKEQWIERWLRHTVGTIVCGNSRARVVLVGAWKGESSAEKMLQDIEGEARVFLSKVYDDLIPPTQGKPANGRPHPVQRTT